ncbi:UDP-galactopyranose mutase [Xiamenia xianingshaonis]|uniref:UDP-galactopyranose mutase n=1 Tax=Xiamenia xianingshaonis TaxID=2682776 RepID=A0A9E6MPG0_9ACTN|nr:UDP-galactopyranose mutase [Xiamenia xianingshaonis]NHM13841.1 UDP-galactopyranose mutase [Xiamenia xianingshaonis]QTU83700.1 UDP-galactopyranose mutase [Xiamenia xianingshaonis]
MKKYDLLIVGAGLFGCVVAHEAHKRGKSVLVIEKRNHIGGNCYTRSVDGINVHQYGAHIFRTADKAIWRYMEQFCEFNHFVNSPIANFKGEIYNMPFNMNTFHALWGVVTPDEARAKIEEQRIPCEDPQNLEQHILSMAGPDIYEKLVRGYTEKQWGRPCTELPPSIMRRIPMRFIYDNNYFRDPYQGIPMGGYTAVMERMLESADIRLETDYLDDREGFDALADLVVYTGPLDALYGYEFGELGYRGLRFEHQLLECPNYQGVAVVNYTDRETPYTRIIEHKHFEFLESPTTVISREYPCDWKPGDEPYYPMEDAENRERYERYRLRAAQEEKLRVGGRLGEYRYYDMQDTVKSALSKAEEWLS